MAKREFARRITEASANSGPKPGDPNPTLPDLLEEIQPRGKGAELPPEFGRVDKPEPITATDWTPPELAAKKAALEEFRLNKPAPRHIPGLVRGDE